MIVPFVYHMSNFKSFILKWRGWGVGSELEIIADTFKPIYIHKLVRTNSAPYQKYI